MTSDDGWWTTVAPNPITHTLSLRLNDHSEQVSGFPPCVQYLVIPLSCTDCIASLVSSCSQDVHSSSSWDRGNSGSGRCTQGLMGMVQVPVAGFTWQLMVVVMLTLRTGLETGVCSTWRQSWLTPVHWLWLSEDDDMDGSVLLSANSPWFSAGLEDLAQEFAHCPA